MDQPELSLEPDPAATHVFAAQELPRLMHVATLVTVSFVVRDPVTRRNNV
jgi:hypothetical protein